MTPAQLATLKADIIADGTLNSKPNNSDGSVAIAAIYNAVAAPDFFVWATSVPTDVVNDNITWANLTPIDAPDATLLWQNRAMVCQGKQFNLQTILQGRAYIDGSKVSVRAGLQDALTNLPSGVSGALLSANWVAVRTALSRKATRFEKLFANVSGGNGLTAINAATMVVEGPLGYQDIDTARNG